ncbi:alanine racemase [Alicyclobacillus macrosporangiidus]|uniref:alanine racemase n=1 Tax=Alicyclobacillus macrosporangiidus TaxID=392015 RepID=UPI0004957B45|nr:alanine racemase [Alicyclobacillus macrosporangiidus]
MHISELPTPAVLVDVDILRKNIEFMAATAKKAGVKLRPHIKTHKMKNVARMQLEAGAIGLTCAKISEAEIMAETGADDILIAFPVVGDIQIERIMNLSKRIKLTIAFDSYFGAAKLNAAASKHGLTVPLYMIIDTGNSRDGVLPGETALQLAREIESLSHVKLVGIMTHEGHVGKARDLGELRELAEDVQKKMVATATLLRENGVKLNDVSIGSTPACKCGIAIDGITEWRPGTYVFNDVNELMVSGSLEQCAVSILATIISHPNAERANLDSGSKILTSDLSKCRDGHGFIKELPNATIERLNEEHGIVRLNGERCEIGQRVTIIPNHVCPVINLMNEVFAVKGNEVIGKWTVDARGMVV